MKRAAAGTQRGVALVTALLVVALATTAAVMMAKQLHIDLRRTANFLHGEQAWSYALAAESWALVVLEKDASDNNTDSASDDWATALPPIAVEGGLVDGEVSDLQGRFNVNNLAPPAPNTKAEFHIRVYKQLLRQLKLEESLAVVLEDWLDENIIPEPFGAEDDTYLLLDPPYRAANRLLSDVSELRLLAGYTPEVIEVLAPHVTALPEVETPINVNTATTEVLLALDENMDGAIVESVLALREEQPFTDQGAFTAATNIVPDVPISGDSNWFRVLTDVQVGAGRGRVVSLVQRRATSATVYQRRRGDHRLLPP